LQTSEFPIPHFVFVFCFQCHVGTPKESRTIPRAGLTVSIPYPKIDCMINPLGHTWKFLGTHIGAYWDEFIADKAVLKLIRDTVGGSEIRRSPVELGSLSHYL